MALLRRVLGDTLRGQRTRQRRTLREVSSTARVSLGYLSEVERGQKEASSELLESICTALGVQLADVLREVSDTMRRGETAAPAVPVVPAAAQRVPVLPRRELGRELVGAGRRPGTAPVSRRPPAPSERDPFERGIRDDRAAAGEQGTDRPLEPVGPAADGAEHRPTDSATPASASLAPLAPAGAEPAAPEGPTAGAADVVAAPVSAFGVEKALFTRIGADDTITDVSGGAMFPRVGETQAGSANSIMGTRIICLPRPAGAVAAA